MLAVSCRVARKVAEVNLKIDATSPGRHCARVNALRVDRAAIPRRGVIDERRPLHADFGTCRIYSPATRIRTSPSAVFKEGRIFHSEVTYCVLMVDDRNRGTVPSISDHRALVKRARLDDGSARAADEQAPTVMISSAAARAVREISSIEHEVARHIQAAARIVVAGPVATLDGDTPQRQRSGDVEDAPTVVGALERFGARAAFDDDVISADGDLRCDCYVRAHGHRRAVDRGVRLKIAL